MLLAVLLSGCASNGPAPPVPADDLVNRLTQALGGSYSSQRQAGADPSYFDLRLHLRPIWSERRGEHWVYLEQALAKDPHQPYRQRIARLQASGADEVVAQLYTLPGDALQYAGAHAHPDLLNWIKPEQLSERVGCAIYFRQDDVDRYSGSTRGDACSSDVRGARFTRIRLVLWRGVLSSWERGFDAQGTQMWGAVTGPYEYDRIAE